MHDPMVIAHEIRRPWPQRSSLPAAGDNVRWQIRLHHEHHDSCAANGCDPSRNPFPWWKSRSYASHWRLAGRDYWWPSLITIWHVEPGGRDALTVCSRRYQDKRGRWHHTRSWRWHIHHWRLQFPPLQQLRRRLLTRCAWCGGHSRKGDPVNISHQWNGPRAGWWRGEPGLFHQDCSSVEHAHRKCLCADPLLEHGGGYGRCLSCGLFRAWGSEPDEADRLLAALPRGSRITADVRPAVEAAWAERRARSEAGS